MKKWVTAILFGTVLVLGACGGGGDNNNNDNNNNNANQTAEADPAEEIYKNSCASCHGSDLEGGAGEPLQNVGSKYSAEEIADIIENGIGSMPAQNVSDEDREALSEWLADKK